MQNLKNDMTKLVARIETVLREYEADDAHLSTCQRIADEFDLWEPLGDGEGFPLWLSFVVAGIGRDKGILD